MAIVKRPRTSGNGRGGSSSSGRTRNPFATDPLAGTIFDDHRTTDGSITPTSNTSRAGKIDPLALIEALKGDGNIWTRFAGNALENGSLGDGSNEAFLQLLQMMQNNPAVAGTYDDDISKKLYEMMLDLWTKNEQRSFDKDKLTEQRNYDSPTNQLARLMGAGISRDAAIQMLQGGQDPALVGSGSDVASAEHQSPLDQSLGVVNTALQAVGAISGLVSLGLSVPQAIAQTAFLKTQNVLLGAQKEAFLASGDAYNILAAAGAGADAFGSVASAGSELSKLAQNGNQDAAQFIASGGLAKMRKNAPFSSNYLHSTYMSERGASDHARLYNATIRKEEASAELGELQISALAVEIQKNSELIDNIIEDTNFKRANTIATMALTRKTNAEALSQEYENQATEALYNSTYEGQSYLEWRSSGLLGELVTQAKIAAMTSKDEYADAAYEALFQDKRAVSAALTFQAMEFKEGMNFAAEYPEQFKLYKGLEKAGAYDYLETKIKAANARPVKIGPFSGTEGYNDPFLTDIENKHGQDFWRSFYGM